MPWNYEFQAKKLTVPRRGTHYYDLWRDFS